MGERLQRILELSKEQTKHHLKNNENSITQATGQKNKIEERLKGLQTDKKELTEHLEKLEEQTRE